MGTQESSSSSIRSLRILKPIPAAINTRSPPIPTTTTGLPKGGSSVNGIEVDGRAVEVVTGLVVEVVTGELVVVVVGNKVVVGITTVLDGINVVVVMSDGSLLWWRCVVVVFMTVVVVSGTVEEVVDVEGSVVVLSKLVVLVLGMVVDTDVLDSGKVVVVLDASTSVVVVVQCSCGLATVWHWSCLLCPGGSGGGFPTATTLNRSRIRTSAPTKALMNRCL